MMNLSSWLAYTVLGKQDVKLRRRRRNHHSGPERDAKYRAFVRTFPCCACGRLEGIEAAHTGHDGGMAQKSSDFSCVPLCKGSCHPEYDNGLRSNHLFEQDWGIDMAKIARDLNRLYFEQRRVA
jgi:hypothetical protein